MTCDRKTRGCSLAVAMLAATALIWAPDCEAMSLRDIADAARRIASPLIEHVTSWWRRTEWEPCLTEAGTVIIIRQAGGFERMGRTGDRYPCPTRFADKDFTIVSFDADAEEDEAAAPRSPVALASAPGDPAASPRSAAETGVKWERRVWWRRQRFSPAETQSPFVMRLR